MIRTCPRCKKNHDNHKFKMCDGCREHIRSGNQRRRELAKASSQPSKMPMYLPTPEEIEKEKEAIRAEWADHRFGIRGAIPAQEYVRVPIVHKLHSPSVRTPLDDF